MFDISFYSRRPLKQRTNIFGSLKSWNSLEDTVTQSSRSLSAIFPEISCYIFEFVDGTGNAAPCDVFQCWVALTVQPEMCVVLPLDEPKSPLITVTAPWLHGERLVKVIIVTLLLIRFLDNGLDSF